MRVLIYQGCSFSSCTYCFAKDVMEFARRKSEHKEFGYLIGNRPDLLKKWIERTLSKEYNYNKAEEVALLER